ncbi:xylulokinase [Hwangdonia lutea]|uniref:FGGY family carbohydrate kinase n=1 Tax=Hwangdonia lutea TaxID=3075823 RepID=A0AA97ENW6_9FLAO|nr:FGGY family carbohydrate kinase [Hwangdonia sp. SCSIO 19198]WOD43880.1 FGGY family carbohydrate kinase [Hwangdonia sp. SCSIO 19198]
MYYLGLNITNSTIKVALANVHSGIKVNTFEAPSKGIKSFENEKDGFDDEGFWLVVCSAIKNLIKDSKIDTDKISGIGISYDSEVLALFNLSHQKTKQLVAFKSLSLSDIKWLSENDQNKYHQIDKIILLGDFIAYKFTHTISTTKDGLVTLGLWHCDKDTWDKSALHRYQIKKSMIPTVVENFKNHGLVTPSASQDTGIPVGTPILFRAAHQASTALAINVLNHGEIAISTQSPTRIYALTNASNPNQNLKIDHELPIGKSMIFKGGYLKYEWLKKQFKENSYEIMNRKASEISIGAEGVTVFPFGNGKEQMLKNINIGTVIKGVNLKNHSKAHLFRATLEGIAFAMVYGIENLKTNKTEFHTINAVNDMLFQSEVFVNTLTSLVELKITTYNTDMAVNAARACSLNLGDFKKYQDIIYENDHAQTFELLKNREPYVEAYQHWKNELKIILKNHL